MYALGRVETDESCDAKGFTALAEVHRSRLGGAPPGAARPHLLATDAAGTLTRTGSGPPTFDRSPEVLDILLIMSSADGWDLTVPEDAAELLAELRRHGVRPGQRLHVVRAAEASTELPDGAPAPPERRELDFIGSVHGGPDDLSIRTEEYLRRGFGHE